MQGEYDFYFGATLFGSIILVFLIDEISSRWIKRSIIKSIEGQTQTTNRFYHHYQKRTWKLFVLISAICWISLLIVLYTIFTPFFMGTWIVGEGTAIPGWVIPIIWTVVAIVFRLERSLRYDTEIMNA